MRQVWTVRLGQQAEQQDYVETIALAIESLEGGPDILGARAREDIEPGIRTLHVARQGRAGRHFVVFRAAGSDIDVLRLLHDSMDLPRHLPSANDHSP